MSIPPWYIFRESKIKKNKKKSFRKSKIKFVYQYTENNSIAMNLSILKKLLTCFVGHSIPNRYSECNMIFSNIRFAKLQVWMVQDETRELRSGWKTFPTHLLGRSKELESITYRSRSQKISQLPRHLTHFLRSWETS